MDERVSRLLLKAVRALPQREQDQVLAALIRAALIGPASVGGPAPFARPASVRRLPDVLFLPDTVSARLGTPFETSGPTAMLPVRLPPELHDRLRRWSNEHGFSMAGVVRGLVERFLDERGRTHERGGSQRRSRRKGTTSPG